jgi:hypothetical protein
MLKKGSKTKENVETRDENKGIKENELKMITSPVIVWHAVLTIDL